MGFIESLSLGFMQRALAAGLIVSLICSVVSVLVVLKRLSFLGVGVSHSAFGGVALGALAGLNLIVTTLVFSTMVALGIGYVSRRGRLPEDTSIGIFFSTAMALGVIVIGFTPGGTVNIFDFLFGNILAVQAADLWLIAIFGSLVLVFIKLFFKELVFFCFDEEQAAIAGLPVTFLYYALLTALAVTVVISMKVVGIILASAMLVIPGAAAYQWTKNYRVMLAISTAIGVSSTMIGLYLSYRFDAASGGAIVLTAALMFVLSLFLGKQGKYSN